MIEKHKNYFFISSVAIFIFSKFLFVSTVELSRKLPTEADDAYMYTSRVNILNKCAKNACNSIEGIKSDINSRSNSEEIAFRKAVDRAGVLVVYKPLYTLLLKALNTFSSDITKTYKVFRILSVIFISSAIAYLIYLLFPKFIASCLLIITSPAIFKAQGIHIMVPSNLALGISAVSWALAIKRKSIILIIIISALSMLCHPMGKLYSLVTIMLTVFNSEEKLLKSLLRNSLFILITAAALLIPILVKDVPLSFSLPTADNKDIFTIFLNNLSMAFGKLNSASSILQCSLTLLIVLTANYFHKKNLITRPSLLFSYGIILLVFLSLFHNLPRYPLELFNRVELIFRFLKYAWILLLAQFIISYIPRTFSKPLENTIKGIVISPVLVYFSILMITDTKTYFLSMNKRIDRHNYQQSTEFIKHIDNHLLQTDLYLINDEILFYMYLSYGNLDKRIVFLKMLSPENLKEITNKYIGKNVYITQTSYNTKTTPYTIESKPVFESNGYRLYKLSKDQLVIKKSTKVNI
ncbi:putative membrane protein [Halobacteriovorax marinus SJ]|uniref:Membrane protein n=1 Tax=Halobacteriovorax marinus (strain ATCC BAA-682 / DSM 15412 / SJ) TaxID=862908 RepID=E1X3G1_HALMS|nr:hypothetical protein [Halobacteriovorax marinus]CBW25256.1 putative membrane protein [Halobacteriovorax marinus SJ]